MRSVLDLQMDEALGVCLKSVAADVRRRIGTMKTAETIRLVTSAATKARFFKQTLNEAD
jgi:hypothetical protein